MLVVVAEHERADAQRVGDRRGVRERDRGREVVVDEVVGHEERRVAERLGLAGLLGELLCREPHLAAMTPKRNVRSCTSAGPYLLASRSIPSRRGRGRCRRGRRPRPTRRARTAGSRAARCGRPGCTSNGSCRIEVHEQHPDLVAVAGVDEAGRVEAR